MMTGRKKSFQLPKLRLHKTSGRGVVELSGRLHYLGRHGTPECQAAYDKITGEWLIKGKKPLDVSPKKFPALTGGISVIELVEKYLEFAVCYYSCDGKPTRGLERVKMAARILNTYFAAVPVAEFGPLKLRDAQKLLVESDKSRKYVNQLTGAIKRIFRWGSSMELCPASVFHSLQTVPGLKKGRCNAREMEKVKPVAEAVLQATLPHLGQVVRDMVQVQRRGGMRPNEICSLRPADIDRCGDIWIYRPPVHKLAYLGQERVIPIGPLAQEILAPYMDRPANQCCFSPREANTFHLAERNAKRKTPLSCGNRVGSNRKAEPRKQPLEKYAVTSYGRAISRACRKAFPAPKELSSDQKKRWHREHSWRPNQLRHLAATELRALGTIQDAQDFLGHSEPATTLIYAERNLGRLIELAKKYG